MSATQTVWSRWFKPAAADSDALPVRLGRRASFSTTSSGSQASRFDHALLAVVLILVVWGAVMVYSATIAMPAVMMMNRPERVSVRR